MRKWLWGIFVLTTFLVADEHPPIFLPIDPSIPIPLTAKTAVSRGIIGPKAVAKLVNALVIVMARSSIT